MTSAAAWKPAAAAGLPPPPLANGEKWIRYDYTYVEPGPLRLNVMGSCVRDKQGKVLKNWIKVTSFELCPDAADRCKEFLPRRVIHYANLHATLDL